MGKAMIFAAGLGTRLKPLTDEKPKALVEVAGIPLIQYVISHLRYSGFTEIIINVHHHADQIRDFLKRNNNFNIHIEISDETEKLLETGGGLKKASWFFNDNKPFLIYNVDILADINLRKFYNSHIRSGAIVSLAVKNRKTSRYFLFDQNNHLCGWKNMTTNEIRIMSRSLTRLQPMAFSGIQVMNPEMLKLLNNEEPVFSITNSYINLCSHYKIQAYTHDNSFWMDIGRSLDLEIANEILEKQNFLINCD